MRNMLFGILLSAFVFGVISLATTKKTVHAEVLTAPRAGRFQLIQLHPSTDAEWSGILDTETGCTWVYTSNNAENPQITNQSFKSYLQVLGRNSFSLVNYDPMEYVNGEFNPDKTLSYGPYMQEISRVTSACSKARLQALSSAGGR